MILLILLLIGGAVLLVPYWLPWAAHPVARKYGIEWSDLSRQGWSSFSMEEVRISQGSNLITIDRLVVPQPLPWLAQGIGTGNHVNMDAGEVTVTIQPGEKAPEAGLSGMDILNSVKDNLHGFLPWIPVASLRSLLITDSEENILFALEDLSLNGHLLKARWPGMGDLPELSLQALLTEHSIRLAAFTPTLVRDLRMTMEILPGLSVPKAYGTLYSDGIPLNIEGVFSSKAWIPDELDARAVNWPVPLELHNWGNLNLPALRADMAFQAKGSNFESELKISGQGVLPGSENDPAVAEFKIKGDSEIVEVSAFSIQVDWLTAHLSMPVSYSIPGKALYGSAQFDLTADLAKQDWIPARGTLVTRASIETGSTYRPDCLFSIIGQEISAAEIFIQELSVEGSFDLSELAFDNILISLDEDSRLNGSGIVSLNRKTIYGQGVFNLAPSWIMPYIEGIQLLSPLSGEFQLQGPYSDILHSGKVESTTFQAGNSHPISFTGDWSGDFIGQIDLNANLQTENGGEAGLEVELKHDKDEKTLQVSVIKAVLEDPFHGAMQLEEPVTVLLDLKAKRPVDTIPSLKLSRNDHYFSTEFDAARQTFSLAGGFINLSFLECWIQQVVPPVMVEHLKLSISQMRPNLNGSFELLARSLDPRLKGMDFRLEGLLDELGLRLLDVHAQFADNPFIDGSIGIPVLLNPFKTDAGRYISAIPGKHFDGSLHVDISSDLFENFPELPFVGQMPDIQVSLTAEGTLEAPEASIDASLSRLDILQLLDERLVDHPFENINFSARLTPERILIENFDANLKQGRLMLEGDLAMESLRSILSEEQPSWTRLLDETELRFQFENLNARDFASVLPDYLRRTGRIDGSIYIEPGMEVTGALQAREFSLRPTLFFQTVDDINMSVDVKDSQLVISKAGASVGKSIVDLSGFIDFSDWRTPLYSLDLQGIRTPLIRTPDFLLHGDIDLHLNKSDSTAPGMLTGDLELRDGLLILDFEPLAARTAGQELPKPPFFSVNASPFSDWILNINIHGDDFLRLRSPYARAIVSSQMDLSGVLSNPIWVGRIFTTEGTIDFPGIRMSLSRSEIFVTRENQSSLQLDLNTIGQMASYVVTSQVSGTVDDPHVEFASTPELSNAQILQLLATGTTGSSNLGSVGFYLGKGLFNPGTGNSLWDRMSVEIGRDITESTKDTIDLYYDISKKLRLHGQYDKYDAQNLNLEWRVFSK